MGHQLRFRPAALKNKTKLETLETQRRAINAC